MEAMAADLSLVWSRVTQTHLSSFNIYPLVVVCCACVQECGVWATRLALCGANSCLSLMCGLQERRFAS